MGRYYPKPYKKLGRNINVKVDLSNYATKTDIKNISHVDTSSFALKTNLASLKTKVDKLDTDKLVPVPVDLSKLSAIVKNVVKNTYYNTKITEIENKIPDISNLATKTALITVENKIPDTSGLVKKTDYSAEITKMEGKTPDISDLVTKTVLPVVENKIPNVTGLATKTELTSIKNKIPDISNFTTKTALTNLSNSVPDITTLIKKSDYDAKIAEIESQYVSNTGFSSKLAQANVITKRNFDSEIIELENNIKKLQTFDSSYFRGKSHFEEDGTQNYLVFQPIIRCFKVNTITNTDYVSSWKSKGLSAKTIKPPTTSDNSLTPLLYYQNNSKICWKLFKTVKNFIQTWKHSDNLHCL